MKRAWITAAVAVTALLASGRSCWAQSSSMFHRAQGGQYGSNQPTMGPSQETSPPPPERQPNPATPTGGTGIAAAPAAALAAVAPAIAHGQDGHATAAPTPSGGATAPQVAAGALGANTPMTASEGDGSPGGGSPGGGSTGFQPVAPPNTGWKPVPQTDAPGLVISPPGQPAPGDLPQAAAAPAAPAAGQPAQPGNVQAASLMSAGPAGPYVRTDPNSPDRGKQAGPSGDGRSRSMSAAVGALQQVSFTATAAPESRRFQLHDLVTIIVREETSAQSDGQSTQDKKYNLDSKLDSWMKLHWGNAPLKPVTLKTSPEIKTENERKLDSTGTFIRKDSFVGRLTAEVIDVKPNGTLVLSARKFVKTDDEEQTFELTGVCRVADLTADNSVLSTQLADLSVSQTHEGQVRDTTKRGWQSWLTDKINPW